MSAAKWLNSSPDLTSHNRERPASREWLAGRAAAEASKFPSGEKSNESIGSWLLKLRSSLSCATSQMLTVPAADEARVFPSGEKARESMTLEHEKRCISLPVLRSHRRMSLSPPPEARILLSCEKVKTSRRRAGL